MAILSIDARFLKNETRLYRNQKLETRKLETRNQKLDCKNETRLYRTLFSNEKACPQVFSCPYNAHGKESIPIFDLDGYCWLYR